MEEQSPCVRGRKREKWQVSELPRSRCSHAGAIIGRDRHRQHERPVSAHPQERKKRDRKPRREISVR